jgi:hypothetical protein
MTRPSLLSLALMLGAGVGCSAATGGGSESDMAPRADAGSRNWGDGGSAGSAGGIVAKLDAAAAVDALSPESEQKLSFIGPRGGARYVYIADPKRNKVSIVDSETLAIDEAEPGSLPTYVATVPGQDVALVINTGSQTLSILRGNGKGTAGMNQDPIPIVAKANAIAIAPDGLHAVIWFDAAEVASSTSSSDQEVSVAYLSGTPRAITMAVGYKPSQIVFSDDGAAAFVVADNGISELRFANITAPAIAPFTPFSNATTSLVRRDGGAAGALDSGSAPDASPGDGPPAPGGGLDGGASLEAGGLDGGGTPSVPPVFGDSPDLGVPAGEDAAPVNVPASNAKVVDVSVTPNGNYAIARREGTAELLLINLVADPNTKPEDRITTLALSSPVTDLDLLPSGNEAFAVLRDENTLVRIAIPAGFTDEIHRTPWPLDVLIGSVTMSTAGKYAMLYSTAVTSSNLVVLDLAQDSYRVVDVKQPVCAVAVAPDEKTALVLHLPPGKTSCTGKTAATAKDKSYGYTMVRLADGFARSKDTAAEPKLFAITPNSTDIFVLLRDDTTSVRIAQRMSLASFTTTDYQLGSPPSSVAALSEKTHKVFVGQEHPQGRITFIDWLTGDVESVTGFALSGRIQQ